MHYISTEAASSVRVSKTTPQTKKNSNGQCHDPRATNWFCFGFTFVPTHCCTVLRKDMETCKKCIPWFDCSNPYKPACNCANCQVEKNGLFSVPKDATCCLCIPSYVGRPILGVIDVFMTPFILVLHYLRIYLIPAILTTVMHLIERFICTLNCCKCGYTDYSYPPNDRSIGACVLIDVRE